MIFEIAAGVLLALAVVGVLLRILLTPGGWDFLVSVLGLGMLGGFLWFAYVVIAY